VGGGGEGKNLGVNVKKIEVNLLEKDGKSLKKKNNILL
jgi:hypothetical protein